MNLDNVIMVLAYLNLAFLGFIAPILVILLSIYSAGRKKLVFQYENEKSQSEENLKSQLKKEGNTSSANLEKIKKTIKELEKIKNNAENKLKSLNPQKQFVKILTPLFISLLTLLLALFYSSNLNIKFKFLWLIDNSIVLISSLILLSSLLFAYSTIQIWILLKVIIQVKTIIDEDKIKQENTSVELLSSLVKLEEVKRMEKVYIVFESKYIDNDNNEFTLKTNELNEFSVGISNQEYNSVQRVEIGFYIPKDFIIEKNRTYDIYTDGKIQIIRYDLDFMQGNTVSYFRSNKLGITPLNEGRFEIKTFVKGENVKTTYNKIYFNISNS